MLAPSVGGKHSAGACRLADEMHRSLPAVMQLQLFVAVQYFSFVFTRGIVGTQRNHSTTTLGDQIAYVQPG
eukprot:jgi/Chrzof1/4302/Cz14g08050.t1